jgi:hypothetical protein
MTGAPITAVTFTELVGYNYSPLSQKDIRPQLQEFMQSNPFLEDFSFGTFNLDEILLWKNDMEGRHFSLIKSAKNLQIQVNGLDENHMKVIENFKDFLSIDQMNPNITSEDELIKDMYKDQLLGSSWNDPEMVVSTYDEKQQAQFHSPYIVKIAIPSGLKSVLNSDSIDEPYIKLCYNDRQCYKAKVVALVDSFPGYWAFSGYSFVQYSYPQVLMSKNDMLLILNDISQNMIEDTQDLPVQKIYFKVRDNTTAIEILQLTSFLQIYIDTSKMFVLNYDKMESQLLKSMDLMVLFTSLFSAIMILLGAYQLILLVD